MFVLHVLVVKLEGGVGGGGRGGRGGGRPGVASMQLYVN